MTLHDRLMLLRAIQGENIADTNDPYPAATAAVDARTVELYKLIDELRADRDAWREQAQYLARRARWWSRTSVT
jgi:hypothetical protein